MRRLFSVGYLSAIGITAFCFQATGSPEHLNARSPLSRCALPEPVRSYLANNPEGFEPIEKKDYSSLLLEYVIDHEGDYIHWLLCADFDGNEKEDYALLVKKNGKISLVVVRTLKDRFVRDILEADVENMPCNLALKSHPLGPTRMGMVDARDPPVKKLRNPAIISSTAKTDDDRLWYWEKGRWYRVYVGL